jgi:uncharacterized protein YbbC (DUF1343 family)/CubicO group peptidase (beta-lactamase class C family)
MNSRFAILRGTSVLLLAATLVATPCWAQKQTGIRSGASDKASAEAFNSAKLAEIDAAINGAISSNKCPGGVLWLEHDGSIYKKAFGKRSLSPTVELMTEETIFDAASLTKVVATTPSIMLLVERGRIDLDAPVTTYFPEFGQNDKAAVTIRHLMTHTSGMHSGLRGDPPWSGYEAAIQRVAAEKLQNTPGTMFLYSDINYITLGEVVRRVSGKKLNEFVAEEIYGPLKMRDSGFLPSPNKVSRIAPTEPDAQGTMLRGIVHDPTSRKMGGVAGHAGLFTTAADLARYARMLLNLGELDGVRIFKPETVKLMTSVQSPRAVATRRGLGWDIDSSYSGPRGQWFPLGSYGHTGWTGTSIWIDPFSKTFVMFLSNRNHPDGKGNVISVRSAIGTLAAEAIRDFDFTQAPAGALAPRPKDEAKFVLNGIDVLVREHFIRLRGLKVGLITNHTGQDRERNPTIDLLKNAPGVELKKLFSPEHGIRGAVDEQVKDSVDEKTGLPIYSLYHDVPPRKEGETAAEHDLMAIRLRSPNEEQLKDIDALIYDIQDISARFYTYSATLGGAIEAAGRFGKKIYVLDRVNPIIGKFEGPIQTRHPSFIGFHTIPVRHGMTFGELAKMFNAEKEFKADLTVVQCENWRHDMWYDETGLPWSHPSPNIRSLNAATLYTGICLLESTRVSMGRGTDAPFETFGAPYVDDVRFAWEMNRAKLPGVSFVPIRFTPTSPRTKPIALKITAWEIGGLSTLAKTVAGKSDPVSVFIYERLDPKTRESLDGYVASGKLPDKLGSMMATNLTKIMREPGLYEESRFKDVKLREETKEFLQRKPEGDDLARLNRLLIEDAYPMDLSRTPKYRDLECGGVHCVVTDRNKMNAVDIGIVAAQTMLRLYPKDFDVDKMALLLGHEETVKAIKDGKSLEEIKESWAVELEKFKKRREQFLIYN